MSKARELRKRLDALNRGPLPGREPPDVDRERLRKKLRGKNKEEPPAEQQDPVRYRRDLPRSESRPPRRRTPREEVALEEALDGYEIDAPNAGRAYLVETAVQGLAETWDPLCGLFRERFLDAASNVRRRIAVRCEEEEIAPEDVLFVDLETTGLSSTPLFLIGVMHCADGGLVVRQFLARDYSEEAATISLFTDMLQRKRLLVTFNGKSFDLPYVRVRAAANRIPFSAEQAHLDLLHECRRVWGQKLPNCKLQTLETHICGRRRDDDIPGAEIPAAYHEYVRTQNAADIVRIVKHNLLDLATLAELMVRMPPPR